MASLVSFKRTSFRLAIAIEHLLPSVIAEKARDWNPSWRNELILERAEKELTDPFIANLGKHGRFFHITVRNLHRDKTALNCYAYLAQATRLSDRAHIPVEAIELKWRGYTVPNAHIPGGTTRDFDAFYILHDVSEKLEFQMFTDASDFIPQIAGEGIYELEYMVVSDNFPPARSKFTLSLNRFLDLTVLR